MRSASNPPDWRWMDRALELAEKGRYTTPPNPMVGAVLVRGGRIVGEGFHRRAGRPHAEVEAIRRAGEAARGADLYVSLEPCPHFGRTPPCSDAILAAGVRRVFIASRDPSREVRGRGVAALEKAGVAVAWAGGAREEAASRLNEKFLLWAARRRPFVLAKWAATLDGRIADRTGRSRWITGSRARHRALELREEYDAVLVGAGTILADNPRLTRRLGLARGRPHRRIVLDGRLRVPPAARAFARPEEAVVATARPPEDARARRLAALGVAVWSLPAAAPGRVSIRRLLAKLAEEEVTSLLVEGGAQTLASFFEARSVDRAAVFVAPRVLGGSTAVAAVGGAGFLLARAPRLSSLETETLGRDLLVTGRVENPSSRHG